jgi:hypothetical protein
MLIILLGIENKLMETELLYKHKADAGAAATISLKSTTPAA